MINLKGKECFIIGAGTSLRGFDFSLLDDKFTIATNHVIEHYDNVDCLIFGDSTFLQKTTYDLRIFKGHIFASKKSCHYPPIAHMHDLPNVTIYIDNRKEVHLDISKGLYHPTSAGILAIHLALIMNPDKIYLLGYDYYKDNGQMHFFPDYEHHKRYKESKLKDKIKMFRPFDDYADKIINLNPDSLVDNFQKKHWSDVL